ncbi:hypothetical protein [Nostoc sp. FACHB-133]|uniref:hypothetical protein n=1 Tax=Nostoc sp. FACHB-133 TaxID=2692835 RepID=UPI001F55512C|nr:hypothetical protein [Nostoc sp. FACHB-133]
MHTALPTAIKYILKSESFDKRGQGENLFGMSIAMPIVQSLLRHAQAGGFGIETADACKNALGGSAPA